MDLDCCKPIKVPVNKSSSGNLAFNKLVLKFFKFPVIPHAVLYWLL